MCEGIERSHSQLIAISDRVGGEGIGVKDSVLSASLEATGAEGEATSVVSVDLESSD